MNEMLERMAIEERNAWLDQVAQEMANEARAEARADFERWGD